MREQMEHAGAPGSRQKLSLYLLTWFSIEILGLSTRTRIPASIFIFISC